MQIFIDTANLDEIRKASALGLVDGVTTNPTLIARENKPSRALLREICSIVDGPVSAEVISLATESMVEEARELCTIAKNIVVKIPLVKEGLGAVKVLAGQGIKTNVTLCFSVSQALLAAKAGATYVSAFIGRLDDISSAGIELVRDIKLVFSNYRFKTQIIVASVRNPLHVVDAAKFQADIVTCPYAVLEQLIKHPLTDLGIQRFLQDYQKIPVERERVSRV